MTIFHKIGFYLLFHSVFFSCRENDTIGQTEITKWKYGKRGAVSITYDDGNINQFKNAMPVMDRLGLPGTFFIVTGEVPGAQFNPKFIGRPVQEIISETAKTLTNKDNFFERASAIGYLGYKGALNFHLRAGSTYENGKTEEAYKIIDTGYSKVRDGALAKDKDTSWEASQSSANTWSAFKAYAAKGHEFGSHTVSHARLAVLDEPNILYELEKSKEDILNNLGEEHVFSAECPFGTENERVMEYAHKIYPSLRNRMPENFLEELNRGSKKSPVASEKEYVQWQRGALTKVPMSMLQSWVDTVSTHDNIWLVLVFHGVDGIGWEPRTTQELETYFQYIKAKEKDLWVATFGNVTKYIRERMNAKLASSRNADAINISLTHSLDTNMYQQDLTLKTYVPREWAAVQVKQDGKTQDLKPGKDEKGHFIVYEAYPNKGDIEISRGN